MDIDDAQREWKGKIERAAVVTGSFALKAVGKMFDRPKKYKPPKIERQKAKKAKNMKGTVYKNIGEMAKNNPKEGVYAISGLDKDKAKYIAKQLQKANRDMVLKKDPSKDLDGNIILNKSGFVVYQYTITVPDSSKGYLADLSEKYRTKDVAKAEKKELKEQIKAAKSKYRENLASKLWEKIKNRVKDINIDDPEL